MRARRGLTQAAGVRGAQAVSQYACEWCGDTGCDLCGRVSWQGVIAFHALATIGLIISYGIACSTLQDAVSYVPDFFRDKWKHDEVLAALGLPLPPRDR